MAPTAAYRRLVERGHWIGAAIGSLLVIGVVVIVASADSEPEDREAPLASFSDLREREILFVEEHDLYLVLEGDRPLALSNDAQHTGDVVEFCVTSRMFESPAHSEKFDIRGHYVGGPARRGLDRYPVRVEGDQIYVDLDHRIAGPLRNTRPARQPEGDFCADP